VTDSTCDLSDSLGDGARVLPPVFRHFGGRRRFGGEVVTARCPEDNSRLKELVGTDGGGRVIVVDGGGSTRCALLGDLVAREALEHGWTGIVVWGCVRDTAVLETLDIGIAALAATPRRSLKHGDGQLGLVVEIAGVPCAPGDTLVADEDGIVLVPRL
jgi:regulator of ribonuclease activity A